MNRVGRDPSLGRRDEREDETVTHHPPSPARERPVRVACLGLASFDRYIAVTTYPEIGGYRVVDDDLATAGGTTANTAVALARLGAAVRLAAVIGDDAEGETIQSVLTAEGVATDWLTVRSKTRTDASTVIVTADPPERTIYWHRGAHIVRGDVLDIGAIFENDVVVVDVADPPLRRFLVDLPAHTAPRAVLLGTLAYLTEAEFHDAFDVVLRHDVVVGSERELLHVTGTWNLSDAVTAVQSRMPGTNLRACIATRGAAGCRIMTREDRWQIPSYPVAAIDPTGAGDAFVAGVAYGLGRRWEWPRIGQFANAIGALATLALGSQRSLPRYAEVERFIQASPTPIAD